MPGDLFIATNDSCDLKSISFVQAEHFDDIDFMDQLLDDLEHSELQSTAYDYQANKLGKPALELDGLQNSTVELAELLKIFSECGEVRAVMDILFSIALCSVYI